jgi:hypothetical protein
MAIAPDHPLALAAAKKNPKLAEFIAEAKRHGTAQEIIDTQEKQGFDTGIKAVHPFDANWKLPVYVANFVLMEYGTGAIFGCPAHDQRSEPGGGHCGRRTPTPTLPLARGGRRARPSANARSISDCATGVFRGSATGAARSRGPHPPEQLKFSSVDVTVKPSEFLICDVPYVKSCGLFLLMRKSVTFIEN